MSRDPVLRSFLDSAAGDARELNRASGVARLVPDPRSGVPADTWHLLLEGIEHFRRAASGEIREARGPLAVRIQFPPDYLLHADPGLVYRVVRLHSPIAHPNVRGSAVCLSGFVPGTRLRSLVSQLHAILTSRVYATTDPLDGEAARFYADHSERVRALASAPLWPRPAARRQRVRSLGEAAR